ncbi:MAG TPA: histidinol-phosphate transaminase [Mycobacteriales bacterium]|jgi:histidinol-phosphate aminotransferase|nr:histidinol-phosphate transaminase [Mycobacteriales bacterium]
MDALPLRDDLRGQSPYGAPQLDVAVALNTNENPYPPSAALVADVTAAIHGVAAGLNRYPDRDCRRLRAALAAYLGHGLEAEQVWPANGSNEILAQLLQAFGGAGRIALGFEPSYSMHPRIAEVTGTGWVAEQRGPDFGLSAQVAVAAVRQHRPALVFLTRPNNPTGSSMPLETVAAVCAAADGIVVVDEAYAEFSVQPSALELLPEHPRLVVSRTMSKAFALAGGRLGYLAASAAVVDALQLVRLPYHLSAVSQAAALAALRHADETLATVAQVATDRDRLAADCAALGLRVCPSDANFLLLQGFSDAPASWQALLDRGVLIRDVGIPGALRVTVGTSAECATFLRALTEVVAAPGALVGRHSSEERA